MTLEKICRTCNENKPITEFKKHKHNKTGYDTVCRACHRVFDKEWQLTPFGKALMIWRGMVHRYKNEPAKVKITKDEWLAWAVPELERLHPFSSVKLFRKNKDVFQIYDDDGVCQVHFIHTPAVAVEVVAKSGGDEKPAPVDEVLELVRKRHAAAVEKLRNKQAQFDEGFVYVISNPAWPEAVKIGQAIDYLDRVKGYQTYDPYRKYKVEKAVHFHNRKQAEALVHASLAEKRLNGEWFGVSVDQAIATLTTLKEELQSVVLK